jgi:hypothetical protein
MILLMLMGPAKAQTMANRYRGGTNAEDTGAAATVGKHAPPWIRQYDQFALSSQFLAHLHHRHHDRVSYVR